MKQLLLRSECDFLISLYNKASLNNNKISYIGPFSDIDILEIFRAKGFIKILEHKPNIPQSQYSLEITNEGIKYLNSVEQQNIIN